MAILLSAITSGQHLRAEEGVDAEQPSERPSPDLLVERDAETEPSRITIPSADGQIAWKDVLQGLTRASELDDAALSDILPEGQFDLTKTGSRAAIFALNVALSPELRLRILPADEERENAALQVIIDERALAKTRRGLKARIRQAFEGDSDPEAESRFGLRLEEDWEKSDEKQQLVLVLHGYNSAPDRVSGLVEAVRAAKLPQGTYAYPNDQSIADSAKRLSDDLKQFAKEHPDRRVALVTHSMGGLVARAAVEDPTLDPGTIDKLIMIAPPTHGSQLARISFGLDIWDHLWQLPLSQQGSRLVATIDDGLAEADHDLRPGSEFLKGLNARGRNEKIRYSLFLGTGGPLTEKGLQSLRDGVDDAAEKSKTVQLIRPRLADILSDFDEVLEGRGDGVVAVKRGRLEGVEDTVLLGFNHLGPAGDSPTDHDRKLHEEIRKRLLE